MKACSILIVFCLLVACAEQPNLGNSDDSTQKIEDSTERIERLRKETEGLIDSVKLQILLRFQEPDLSMPGPDTYRFCLLDHKTFFDGMQVYGIYSDSTGYYCTQKYFTLTDQGKSDSLITSTRKITEEDWLEVQRLVNGAYFWSMETNHVGAVGLTDDLWVLEGRSVSKHVSNQRSYHLVRRWTTVHDGSFKSACLKIQEICER